MTEWKDIEGWEEYYEVNSMGQVRNKETNHILTVNKNSTGYCRITLYRKEHTPAQQKFFVHRLVAKAFIPNPDNLLEVNHIDCDIENNSVENLEWIDKVNNERHSRMFGSKEYKPFAIQTADGKCYTFDFKIDLAQKLKVTPRTVKNWLDHLSKGYKKHGILSINYIEQN